MAVDALEGARSVLATCWISALLGLIWAGSRRRVRLMFLILRAVLSAESLMAARMSCDFLEFILNLSARSTLSLLVARLSWPLDPACV